MPRSAAFLLILLAAPALAADIALEKPPYVEVGDCWTYRARNIENRGLIKEFEECVSFVDRTKGLILAVAKVADGREVDTSYSMDWRPRAEISGLIRTPTRKATPAQYPLRIGDTYFEEAEFTRALLGTFAGKVSMTFKVVGWEEVTVPAGRFRALKIEGNGVSTRYDTGRSNQVRTEFWYVPEVRRYVKHRFQSPALDYGVELTAYRLNQ